MKTRICRMLAAVPLCCVAACPVASAQRDSETQPTKQGRLDLARKLIHETPMPGQLHNPLRVVWSVNCLHSLGKKQAISLLFEVFPKPDADHEHRVPGFDERKVSMIIPILFEVPDDGKPPPAPYYCKRTRKWVGPEGTQVIQGDIPFAITGQWTYGGLVGPTRPLVEWASKHGNLRAQPLRPQDDPLQAADALLDRIASGEVPEFGDRYKHIDESARKGVVESLQDDLRAQAKRMLHNGMFDLKVLAWDEMRREVARLGIRWYPEFEAHIFISSEHADFDAETVLREVYLARNEHRTFWSVGTTLHRMRIGFDVRKPAANRQEMDQILQKLCDEGHLIKRGDSERVGEYGVNETVYERVPGRELIADN